MEINDNNSDKRTKNHNVSKQQYFLTAEALLKYLLGKNERITTLILCKNMDCDLITTDYELYQAFGSIKKYDNVTKAKLVKLFENVDILSHRKERGKEKKILTHERVEQLRNKSLGDDKNE